MERTSYKSKIKLALANAIEKTVAGVGFSDLVLENLATAVQEELQLEDVLVVSRLDCSRATVLKQGFTPLGENFLIDFLNKTKQRFVARPEAELDPSLKQLIPYILLRVGDKYGIYKRGSSGGEKRLIDKYSMGIGGHINQCDSAIGVHGINVIVNCMFRELAEEVNFEQSEKHTFKGMIYYDSDAVGKVHLGLVYIVDLKEEALVNEDALQDLQFLTIAEIKRQWKEPELEVWTREILKHLHYLK